MRDTVSFRGGKLHEKKINFIDIIIIIVLSVMALSCLIPILNSIAISFSDKTNAALGNVYFGL